MGAVTFDSRWLKIWRGTWQLLGENSKSVQKNEILSNQILISKLYLGRDQWESLTYVMSSMWFCMELDLLSVQVIKSQLC